MNEATLVRQLRRQIAGGELSDFLSEEYRSERSDLKPLGSAGRGITYPGTDDVPGVLTDALAGPADVPGARSTALLRRVLFGVQPYVYWVLRNPVKSLLTVGGLFVLWRRRQKRK